ncbi:MAG TPA: lipid A-modifier LpxR family protein [Flavobacteriales bacterium]|nr:lipid A-modifier LpxR family protein [Flavobacteriales bacterium]
MKGKIKLAIFLFMPFQVFSQGNGVELPGDKPIHVPPKTNGDIDIVVNETGIVPGSFTIATDQDFLFFFPKSKNEDRNYTQGSSFTYSHPRLYRSVFFSPFRLIKKLDDRNMREYSSSIAICGTGFTPRAIDSLLPVVGDRPFAFVLYLSTSQVFRKDKLISKFRSDETQTLPIYHTFTINYGVFGTNLGYEFQTYAHAHLIKGRPEPYGWVNQISKGGSPTLLIAYNKFRPVPWFSDRTYIDSKHHSVVDMGWNFGGSTGYYDRMYTGLYARLGYLLPDNIARWNGGWNALNSANLQEEKFEEKKKVMECFIYGRITGSFMFRNSMLVGQRFVPSIYTMQPEWTKTGLLEYEWGLTFNFENKRGTENAFRSTSLTLRSVYRSAEFDSHLFPERWHYFGGLSLSIPVR